MATTGKKPRQAPVPFDISAGQPTQASSKSIRSARTLVHLSRTREQLKRRTRELKEAQDVFLTRMHDYEDKLRLLAEEKVEAMEMAQELHEEIVSHERRQKALNDLLQEMDDGADEGVGFLSLYRFQNLFAKLRALMKGGL